MTFFSSDTSHFRVAAAWCWALIKASSCASDLDKIIEARLKPKTLCIESDEFFHSGVALFMMTRVAERSGAGGARGVSPCLTARTNRPGWAGDRRVGGGAGVRRRGPPPKGLTFVNQI